MKRTTVSGTVLTLLLIGTLTLAFNIQPVRGEGGTIYIRADGSIDPPTAPIKRVGNTYTFTDNIIGSIVVERDNIVIDGNDHTLQGAYAHSGGFVLSGRSDVTITKTHIKEYACGGGGVDLVNSRNNRIEGNLITDSNGAIQLSSSSHGNIITKNNITKNGIGVYLKSSSSENTIADNLINNNIAYPVYIFDLCANNNIINNSLTNNGNGVCLFDSPSNKIMGNSITAGLYLYESSGNVIDGNNITKGGLTLVGCYSNIVINNVITKSWQGLLLELASSGNVLRNNTLSNNEYNFCIDAWFGAGINDIDTSNTVNGKPIYHLVNQTNLVIDPLTYPNIGYLALINSENITIQNLNLAGNMPGLLLVETANSTIVNNVITNNVQGISLLDSRGNNITSNTVTNNNEWGIELSGSYRNTIATNIVTNNSGGYGWGIALEYFSGRNLVIGNTVTNNGWHGIFLYRNGRPWTPDRNNITNNYIANNGDGIGLWRFIFNNTVVGNTIINNKGKGIELQGEAGDVSKNTIAGNNIYGNAYGIYVYEWSNDNIIYHNNFVDNAVQVYSVGSTNVWDDGYPSGGNYWSDYVGNDTDNDKIGDTPYVIDANNQDRYPLMAPWAPWQSPHDIAITKLSKTTLGSGYNTLIYVTVFNKGFFSEQVSLTLSINGEEFATQTFDSAERSLTTVTFTWNTAGFAKGNYTLSAYAAPVPGEIETADNTRSDGWVFITVPGDINGDKVVNVLDAVLLSRYFGRPDLNPSCDINGDGYTNVQDTLVLIAHFGEHW